MLDLAGIAFGNGVLDVVADFGEQTFVAARRVSAKGWVRLVGFIRSGSTRGPPRPVQCPRLAEADRVAELKEVAVLLRRLRTRRGERHVQRKQRVEVNLSGLRRLP